MEEDKQHFWHIMLYYFKKGENATKMQIKICAVYGEGAVTDQTCQKWFVKFCAGDFLLDNAPWWGRPGEVDRDHMETFTENNQHTTWEIANILKNIQINKVTGENGKCVFYFVKKTHTEFLANSVLQ